MTHARINRNTCTAFQHSNSATTTNAVIPTIVQIRCNGMAFPFNGFSLFSNSIVVMFMPSLTSTTSVLNSFKQLYTKTSINQKNITKHTNKNTKNNKKKTNLKHKKKQKKQQKKKINKNKKT